MPKKPNDPGPAGPTPETRGRKPTEEGPAGYRPSMKCHRAYFLWLEEFALSEGGKIPALFAAALAEYAIKKGFRPPPKR